MKGEVAPSRTGVTASAAVAVKKKMSIRPSSDSTLNEGKQVGGVPLGSAEAQANVAGVSKVNSAVDESTIPYAKGGYRPTTRFGKKNSTDNFVINNTISEQIAPEVDEAKDLREAPDAVQGYNGIKQFKTARGKKNAGYTPASFLFDRSVDFMEHDAIVHTTGQVLDNISSKANYPTTTTDTTGKAVPITKPMSKSNYLLKGLKFSVTDGHISSVEFDEECFVANAPAAVIEQANLNWQVDANNVANTIVKLQSELGRETTDKWSPLGYVINNPYEYNMLMHDIEATTGALAAAAYKSASHALSFQINKLGKDGAKSISPIYEMAMAASGCALDSKVFENVGDTNLTNALFGQGSNVPASLIKGSPVGIIKMFDSTSKYTSKADFLNQPRSFKFHLQTADNNINPFHCKPEFLKAYDKVCLFSTEDGSYNPMLPIHIGGDIKVMNPLSLNFFMRGWTNPNTDATNPNKDAGTKSIYTYQYNDLRFKYDWSVRHPLVDGLLRWMLRHEAAIVKAYGSNATDIYWPANFSNTKLSMLALALCSASQDIAWMRNIIFRDVIFAGEQSSYIWDDLQSLKDLNPVHASQYAYSDYSTGLKLGKMAPDTALRIYWSEYISYHGDNDNINERVYGLPWYFNENALGTNYSDTGFFSTNTPNVMSMPSFRGGVNHAMCDLIYSMSERDVRLALDRMVDVPQCSFTIDKDAAIYNSTGGTKAAFYAPCATTAGYSGIGIYNTSGDTVSNMNDDAVFGAIRYDKVSDGRVIMKHKNRYLREDTYLITPRELGYIFTMPAGFKTIYKTFFDTPVADLNTCHRLIDGSHPISLISYSAYGSDLDSATIDRSASLQQKWTRVMALRNTDVVTHNNGAIDDGVVPAIGAFINGANATATPTLDIDVVSKKGVYSLGSAQLSTALPFNAFVSLSSFLWTLLQRVYLPINPFEAAYDANDTTTGNNTPDAAPRIDPLESAMYFGFCGCLASDYNQDVLERLNVKDELGMYYTTDEFIKSSLIFR